MDDRDHELGIGAAAPRNLTKNEPMQVLRLQILKAKRLVPEMRG